MLLVVARGRVFSEEHHAQTSATTTPRWVGFVNDGWGVDADGKWFHVEKAAWENETRGRQMQRLRRDLADLDEVLDGVAEDLLEGGNVPFLDGDAATMETARRALRRLPKQLRKRFWTSAKVELRPVKSLPSKSIYLMPGEDQAAGLCRGKTAVVASQCGDLECTILHEAGHILDNLRGHHRISGTPQWESLWKLERRAGRIW